MPVRNAGESLRAALDSVLAQTFPAWELVAIDDGSTDPSAAMLEHYSAREPRIRVLRQPASGIVAALQRGCSEARGEFIARMDADDVMHPQRIEAQVRHLTSNPHTGLVSCLVNYGGDRTAHGGYAAHVDWVNSLVAPEQIRLRRFVESPVAHPSVMFRRELAARHGGYREGEFPEDYELWLRWMDAGVRFEKVDAALMTWNDPEHRLSRVDMRYSVEAFYRIKCHYLARSLRGEGAMAARRPIWMWGAGRITRKRFAYLEQEGVRLDGFIDVDPAKFGRLPDGRRVVGPEDIPSDAFVLAGVGVRGARELITTRLQEMGRTEGEDFLLA